MSQQKLSLTPYGVWYYGETFDKLIEKLDNALRGILYFAPDVKGELEVLSELEQVEGFNDIGRAIREWLNFVRSRFLDWQSCRKLQEESNYWKNTFMQRVNERLLVRPTLQRLNFQRIRKELTNLPEDVTISEWLKADEARLREFREGCSALLYGLSTAAGFYFLRLVERALREFYERETGKSACRKMLGEILDELESYCKEKQKIDILKFVSYLKDVRNKVMHADRFLTQEEAEALYIYTLDIIKKLQEFKMMKVT
jgi:hypothetical protein